MKQVLLLEGRILTYLAFVVAAAGNDRTVTPKLQSLFG